MLEREVNLELKMSDIEKAEISFLKNNFAKLKTIANFLDISLEEVTNTCLYPGLYKFWLPIAKIIDEFPDEDLDSGEDIEKIYSLKQNYIKEIYTAYKTNLKIETIEKKSKKKQISNKHFNSDLELKEVAKKVIPLKVKGTAQVEDFSVPKRISSMRIFLEFLFKVIVFVLFFIAPIFLFVTILTTFFYWNYLTLLRYQPLLFFLLTIVMILVGFVSGYLSLLLTRYYLKSSKERHAYEKLREEFNKETPYSEFEEGKEGRTITQWYQQFEEFLESKKKDK